MVNRSEIILVENLEHALVICKWLADYLTMVAIDLEGVDFGRDGRITMLQIGTDGNTVFCFDILTLGDVVFSTEYLGQILNSEQICKLCYDCRTDADILRTKYNVNMNNVYDIQVLYTFIFQKEQDPSLKGLHHALQSPGILNSKMAKKVIKQKLDFKESLLSKNTKIFMQRPLTETVLQYCAADVVHLFQMFSVWGTLVDFHVVVQASMYRLHKFCNRNKIIPPKKMAFIDFKQMPVMRCVASP